MIEVLAYRHWVMKRARNTKPIGFCILLIDIYGNTIQAIADYSQKRHFTNLLQLNSAYRLSNFICEPVNQYDKAVSNITCISIGEQLTFEGIPTEGFPREHFEFTHHSSLQLSTITDNGNLQLSGTSGTHYFFNSDIDEFHQSIDLYREKVEKSP
ncbi:uncharacterized protein [Rutidosis leptorrhynchoides]|uniref:uncharacterized protein n=1 Tax=Rutidosis leptorrhynchoides TaxID=125765 RepID=UPI003A9942F6